MTTFDLVNEYFKDLVFKNVETKNGFCIYAAKINSRLAGGYKRYVLLFVPTALSFKTQDHIYNLEWENLQTRTIIHNYNINSQKWDGMNGGVQNILDNLRGIGGEIPIFEVDQRTDKSTSYHVPDGSVNVELLHDPKKKTIYQYNNKMNMEGILSTFNSSITRKRNVINTHVNRTQIQHIPHPSRDNWFTVPLPDTSPKERDYILL